MVETSTRQGPLPGPSSSAGTARSSPDEVRLFVVTRCRDWRQLGTHHTSWLSLTQRFGLVDGNLAGSGSHAKRVLSLSEAEDYWRNEGRLGTPPLHGL